MARRASNPPSRHLHDMTKTWTNPTSGRDSAPGENTGGLSYREALDRYDGKVHTVKTRDMEDHAPAVWPAGLGPSKHYGKTCGVCFVQRSRSGDCLC